MQTPKAQMAQETFLDNMNNLIDQNQGERFKYLDEFKKEKEAEILENLLRDEVQNNKSRLGSIIKKKAQEDGKKLDDLIRKSAAALSALCNESGVGVNLAIGILNNQKVNGSATKLIESIAR